MNRNSNPKFDSIDKSYDQTTQIPKLKSSDIAEPTVFELDEMLPFIEI